MEGARLVMQQFANTVAMPWLGRSRRMGTTKNPREKARVRVPSRAEDVGMVRKFIRALSGVDGFAEDDMLSIEVAVGEALANAVRHGSPRGEDDTVEVTYTVDAGAIEVSVHDHGKGFDLQQHLLHVDPQSLCEGERGLFLIAALMDEVAYTRTPSGGCLSIRKSLPGAAPPSDRGFFGV